MNTITKSTIRNHSKVMPQIMNIIRMLDDIQNMPHNKKDEQVARNIKNVKNKLFELI